jgi:hypothetical protein
MTRKEKAKISVRNNDFGSDSTKAIAKIGFNGKLSTIVPMRAVQTTSGTRKLVLQISYSTKTG